MTDSFELDAGQNLQAVVQRELELAASRVVERCDLLAHSTDGDGLTRLFCSPAMRSAHQQLSKWFSNAGLKSILDPVGNLIGRPEPNPNTIEANSVFMIGSHLDTVVNAGRFDGMLGVLLGLATAEVLQAANIELGFDLHVVAFSEEEGVRYKMPFIGSRGIAGTFDPADFDLVDAKGIRMRDALANFGCQPDQWESASYANINLIGFMETHLEQATILEEANIPVGVVSAIAGQTRTTIVVDGLAGHAGTVPHNRRRDALAAAAEIVLGIERLGQETPGLFATVGNVIASPGLSNVISGRAELRVDLRHEADVYRLSAYEKITQLIEEVSQSRGVTGSVASVQHTPAVPMDAVFSRLLVSTIEECGITPRSMVSGAGHDAMVMSNVSPSCMLFVRCRDGISHHPDELVSPADVLVALRVMVGALIKLSESRAV